MKVAYVEDSGGNAAGSYAGNVIRTLMPADREDPQKADIVLVTVNDITQLKWLKKVRESLGDDKYIIAGGPEAFNGETLLAYANMVNVGEGFEFFDAMHEVLDLNWKRFEDHMEQRPYVLTRKKSDNGETVIPSTRIDWDRIPVVQQSKTNYYYLLSKGCPRRCHFCYTSWTQPYMRNTNENINKIISYFTKNKKLCLTFVSNEGHDFNPGGAKIASKSVMVKQFLEDPKKYTNTNLLHIGVEGFSEKVRAKLGKPISNLELAELLFWTKKLGINAEWFFILDLPGDNREELFSALMKDSDLKPPIQLQFHWLERSPHTPFWRLPVDVPYEPFDRDDFFFRIQAINRRFRTRPFREPGHAVWRTVIKRIPWRQVDQCVSLEKIGDRNAQIGEWKKRGLGEYLNPEDGLKLANEIIKCPFDSDIKKFAELWRG